MIEFRLQSLSLFFGGANLGWYGQKYSTNNIFFFPSSCKEKGKGKTNRRPPSPAVKDGDSTKK